MAKRNRGSNRPGQRRPDRHGHAHQQNRPAPRPAQGLSAAEEANAAALESEIVAQDRAAQTMRSRVAAPGVEVAPAPRPRTGTPLAVRAAAEYAYVSRDVRRILRVGGSMTAILAILFVLIRVLNVISI